MKIIILFLIGTIMISSTIIKSDGGNKEINLMPIPKNITFEDGKFVLEKSFSIGIAGIKSERIRKYADRVSRQLSNRTGIFLDNPYLNFESNIKTNQLTLSANRIGKLEVYEDESYSLKISSVGIDLSAETDLGIMRGLETFLQLLESDENGYYFPAVTIDDSPRFPWRGLLIDVCRHFMSVDMIKRNLDGMAAVKMNVLHWHLSEDQGFRVESKVFPKLHEIGSNGFYYTQAEIKDIIEYAADRGIRVLPEFDIPGHASSWIAAYPELASGPGPYLVDRNFGVLNPTINPTLASTYQFLEKFFEEMSALFPDAYMHIGGDENNGKQWDENKDIQKFMKENGFESNHELQAYFNKRILDILTKNNKKMIGWDEILHEDIPKNIVIQSWRGTQALVDAAKNGYMGLLSNGYYIDLVQPTEYHYLNDPIIENADLTAEEEARILGGEATMWAEWVTEENVDSRIWPRTAAIAERFWSSQNVKDVPDMYRRLEKISLLLEEHDLKHISFQEKMMRRLTGGEDTKPLKVLLDVIEPLERYSRSNDAKKHGFIFNQKSAYTRVVDATMVDPKVARDFNNSVESYLKNKDEISLTIIKTYLNKWKENHNKLLPIINNSPILTEVEALSKNLKLLAEIGLKAISDKNYDKEKAKEIIEKTKISIGQTEIIIIKSIEHLVS